MFVKLMLLIFISVCPFVSKMSDDIVHHGTVLISCETLVISNYTCCLAIVCETVSENQHARIVGLKGRDFFFFLFHLDQRACVFVGLVFVVSADLAVVS